jgi:hypothetical protein
VVMMLLQQQYFVVNQEASSAFVNCKMEKELQSSQKKNERKL